MNHPYFVKTTPLGFCILSVAKNVREATAPKQQVPVVEATVSKIYTLLAENFVLLDKIRKFLADH